MALAHSAVGAAGSHTTGGNQATFPFASPAAGTVAVLLVETKPETLFVTAAVGTSSRPMAEITPLAGTTGGFTGGTGSFGADTGQVRVQAFLYICRGDESTGNAIVTLNSTATNSSVNGRVVQATRSAASTISAAAAGGADNSAASSWSAAMTTNPGIQTGDLCYTLVGAPTDTLPTFGSSAMTATGITFTEGFVANPTSASGNDTGGRIESWTTSGTATGAATHTIALTGTTTNWAGAEILVRLREVFTPRLPLVITPTVRASTR